MNIINSTSEFKSDEDLFITELITNNKKSKESTSFTSSKVNNNEINKISNNEITDLNSISEIEETSTSNNIGSTESSTNNNDLFSNSLFVSSLNSIDTTNTVIFSTILESTTENITNEIINFNSSLVLLGFSHLRTSNLVLSFYIHFALLDGYLASNNLKFPVQIIYNFFLRILENFESNCDLVNELNQKLFIFIELKQKILK